MPEIVKGDAQRNLESECDIGQGLSVSYVFVDVRLKNVGKYFM